MAAVKLTYSLVATPLSRVTALASFSAALCLRFSLLYPLLMIAGGAASLLFLAFKNSHYSALPSDPNISAANSPSLANLSTHSPSSSNSPEPLDPQDQQSPVSVSVAVATLAIFVLFLLASLVLQSLDSRPANVFATFYAVGSIIFGGGPVVIPYSYLHPNSIVCCKSILANG